MTVNCSRGNSACGGSVVLGDAEFVERLQELGRQEVVHDLGDGLERETGPRQVHLPGGTDDVGLLPGMHDQRLAIDADHGLEQ